MGYGIQSEFLSISHICRALSICICMGRFGAKSYLCISPEREANLIGNTHCGGLIIVKYVTIIQSGDSVWLKLNPATGVNAAFPMTAA